MPRGKCDSCLVRWSWNGRPRVSQALCPSCKRPLTVTSQNSLLPELGAYATSGMRNTGPKYLTADPTEISKLRRRLARIAASGAIKPDPLSRRITSG